VVWDDSDIKGFTSMTGLVDNLGVKVKVILLFVLSDEEDIFLRVTIGENKI